MRAGRASRPVAPLVTLVAALLAVVLLGACSTVPSSSATMPIGQVDRSPSGDVDIQALGPAPGASPEDVVRGFLEASASPVLDHPVAREFLTPSAAGSWSDTEGITVIRSDYAAVPTGSGEVDLIATQVGSVDERGSFTSADGVSLERDFTLEQVDGEWRISDPDDGLIVLQPDFAQTYDEVDAFFLDPTGDRLVPDPLFLISGEAQPTSLVERVIGGASPALARGVTNPLAGATLRSAVSVSGQTATVDLTDVDASEESLAAISAQLAWSLDQLGVRNLRLRVDGQPVRLDNLPAEQTIDTWAALDPDAAPVESVGHYLSAGAVRTVDGDAVPGPAGAGVYGLVSAAVSADPRTGALATMVGVGAGGVLFAGPYGGELAPLLTGTSLTPPTVAATRQEVWTVRDGREVIRLPSGGPPQVVDAAVLTDRGVVTALQLSPDGVRAAAVVDGAAGRQLFVATVVRTDAGVALENPRAIAPRLTEVSGVAWRNAATLLVLAPDQAGRRTVPYSVGVDGWGLSDVTTGGLPSPPTAVAAAPSRQPLVSAGANVWRLSGGRWVTLVPGSGPLPGDQPFYPL